MMEEGKMAMLAELKRNVCEANLQLVRLQLVVLTWGNASAISADRRFVVIKPSGVDYASLVPEQMVVTDLDGHIMDGSLRPSSDLPTHLELYRQFPTIGAIVHTHSRWATALAQAERDLPCYGTTHADHFYGAVPCTRQLTATEIADNYERNTGRVIVETFAQRGIDPAAVPAVLVSKHGPFAWGGDCRKAVENALVLDETAHMALLTEQFNPEVAAAAQYLQDKHYFRKHGAHAYYGQAPDKA